VLDLVDKWLLLPCRNPACGRGIDVNWLRQDGDSTFSWADDETLVWHCPECLVNEAPDDDKPSVAAFYDRIRAVRRDIGRGESQAPSVTLSVTKWHLPPIPKGRRRDGPDDPYMEEFSILGLILHPEGRPPDFKRLSRFPLYRPWLPEPPVPMPSWVEELLFLTPAATPVQAQLALYAFHPRIPGAHRRFLWDPSDPTAEYSLVTHGWRGLSPQQLHEFENETLKLFAAVQNRGRPPGTTDFTREGLDQLLVAHVAQHGAVPKLKDFLAENFIGDSTFKKYRKRYHMGTYRQWTKEVLGPRR
jgi:hypothetical protein